MQGQEAQILFEKKGKMDLSLCQRHLLERKNALSNQFQLVWRGSWHGIFICISFGGLASVGPAGDYRLFQPTCTPRRWVGRSLLRFPMVFQLCTRPNHLCLQYCTQYSIHYHMMISICDMVMQYCYNHGCDWTWRSILSLYDIVMLYSIVIY